MLTAQINHGPTKPSLYVLPLYSDVRGAVTPVYLPFVYFCITVVHTSRVSIVLEGQPTPKLTK